MINKLRLKCGLLLREMIEQRFEPEAIGSWAYIFYSDEIVYADVDDSNLERLLLCLTGMEDGPEFAYSYERLSEIAEDLIEGREIDAGYRKTIKPESAKKEEVPQRTLKQQFGKELLEMVLLEESPAQIAQLALSFYSNNSDNREIANDQDFSDLLLAINMMDLGSEHKISLDTLDKVADDLLENKAFPINSRRYQIQIAFKADVWKMFKKGNNPVDVNGDKIIYHHFGQQYHRAEGAFMAQIPEPKHGIWNPVQHPYGNAKGAGLNKLERNEWKNKDNPMLNKVFGEHELKKRGLLDE